MPTTPTSQPARARPGPSAGTSTPSASESYVNLIPTVAGGTHESGLRAGVFEAVKSFIEHRALLPRGVKLQQDDVCGRMAFVLSARILDPQFQGQVKEKLNSREAVKLVSSMVRDPFEIWLNQHVEAGKAIAELSIRQALARQKNAQKVEKRKQSGVAVLPGKLSDCESTDIAENETVPGRGRFRGRLGQDGAQQGNPGHPAAARQGAQLLGSRARATLFANNEIHDIAVALGIDPHGAEDSPDLSPTCAMAS
jgi:topoisomerase-4 subunit B